MAKETKRNKANSEHVDSTKQYGLEEACQVVVKAGNAKFDESVDVAIRLGVDPKNCLLYTSPSPRDLSTSRMPSSA